MLNNKLKKNIYLRDMGLQDYALIYQNMHYFTETRKYNTIDEIWCVEHYPIFTIGRSGDENDILSKINIPIMKSDRGGKITYHGPGQQIIYVLLDLKRNNINIKQLINNLEKVVIYTLNELGIYSYKKDKQPGIYVKKKKFVLLVYVFLMVIHYMD